MPSKFYAGLGMLAIRQTLGQVPAQFTALNGTTDYGSLQPCQQGCLAEGNFSQWYDTQPDAEDSCKHLDVRLWEVGNCTSGACAENDNASAAVYTAKSLLASYCSSIGTAYSFPVPVTIIPALSASKFIRESNSTWSSPR